MILINLRRLFFRTIFIFFVIKAFFVSDAFGQEYPFREYNVLDGLPQSQATSIFQDSRGFIWISTRNGLARFDGIDFVNYTRKDGLPTNDFSEVMEDSLGVIWISSNKYGLSKFDGTRFQFFPISGNVVSDPKIVTPTGYESNVIYFLGPLPGKDNLRILRFSKGKYFDYSSRFKAFDTLYLASVTITSSQDGFLLLDKYRNIWIWKDSILTKVSEMKIDNIIDENGTYIFKKGNSIYEYVNGRLQVRPLETDDGQVNVGYDFRAPTKSVTLFEGRTFNRIDLPFIPSKAFIDREGILWFPSEKNVQRLISTSFSSYNQLNIGVGNIWAIGEDRNGHLWFGSLYGDLVENDGQGFRKRNDYVSVMGKEVPFYKGSRRMSDGDLWLSTSNGVLIWDGKKFSRLKFLNPDSQVCYIYEDPDNKTVMIGAGEGLYIIKNGKATIRRELTDTDLGVVEGITKDRDGTYWLSGHKGLVRMMGDSISTVDEDVFPHINSYTLVTDKSGGIWVTSEDGLYFKDWDSDKFNLALPDPLNAPANSIILMDSLRVLVGRVSDICIIDVENYHSNHSEGFRLYDKSDGFAGDDCLDNGIIKDQEGNFWIVTSNRIVKFEPSKLKINHNPPLLNFTGCFYKNDSLEWVPCSNKGFYYKAPADLNLKRNQNTVKITFTGISTTNPEKVTYSYRLVGFNEKWSHPGKERSVIYENLPHGKYRFELTGSNADGIPAEKTRNFDFRILPAFWQTSLFKILAIFLFIVVNFLTTRFIVRKRHKRQANEQRYKSELAQLQMNSVIRQFDPHFTFNVISSVGSLIMKEKRDSAYEYITRLSGLLRSVLNDESIVIKPLSDELEFVTSYCELQQLRYKDRLNYSINVDPKVDRNRMVPKMTIQTFVENAIKHGFEHRKKGGKVDIEVMHSDSSLEITILDDGIGREAARKQHSAGTGRGLKTITDIFDLMNKFNRNQAHVEINDLTNNGSPSGTMVRIIIPDDYNYNNF